MAANPGMIASARQVYQYRDLIRNLTARDLKAKYKRSVLGIGWSLLNPILLTLVYTVVFSVFLRIANVHNYWAMVLGGIIVWTFFAASLSSAAVSFVHGSSLISKVYLPVESLAISTVLGHFINFAISVALVVAIEVAAGVHLGLSVVLLPVLMLLELVFVVGLSLLVASATVYFRDLEYLIGLGLTVFFYLTPILYPLRASALPHGAERLFPYLQANPMTWYVESFHSVLFYGTWPDAWYLAGAVAAALVALIGGYAFFLRIRARLPEEV